MLWFIPPSTPNPPNGDLIYGREAAAFSICLYNHKSCCEDRSPQDDLYITNNDNPSENKISPLRVIQGLSVEGHCTNKSNGSNAEVQQQTMYKRQHHYLHWGSFVIGKKKSVMVSLAYFSLTN